MRNFSVPLRKIALFALVSLTLNGCWDQRVFEKIGFILNLGIDKNGDEILLTFTSPVIQEKEEVDVNVVSGSIVREGRESARLESPRKIEGGKLQNILIGESIAKEGILDYLEIIERSISNPTQSWLIIIDGSANEFISEAGHLEGKPRLAFYLNQLIESNIQSGYCPEETVIKYDIEESVPGVDPVIPIVKINEDSVRISGTALMNRDKMSGRFDYQQTAYLMLASGKNKKSVFFFDLEGQLEGNKKKIAVTNQKSKVKSKLTMDGDLPKMTFDIDMNLILDEYMWDNLADRKKESLIEQFLADKITRNLGEMFKKLQEANCDAIGIGDMVRAKYNGYWNGIGEENGWKKVYPKIKAEFTVKTNIIRYGVIQ